MLIHKNLKDHPLPPIFALVAGESHWGGESEEPADLNSRDMVGGSINRGHSGGNSQGR